MRTETIRTNAGRDTQSHIWKVVLCGLAGLALASPAVARDITLDANGPVDIRTTVIAVREVPAGNPLPGLHVDARIKGRIMDIYIAPESFAAKYGVKVSKGAEVHIVGAQAKAGADDVVLAREIGTGIVDQRTGAFHETLSIYLRNDNGPLWDDDTK